MEKFFKNKVAVVLMSVLCAVLWGVGYSCTKKGYELFAIASGDVASKIVFAGARFVLAGLIALVASWIITKSAPDFPVKKTGGVLVFALFQTFLQYAALYVALGNMSGAKSSILNQTGAFLLILLSHFIYKSDKFSAMKVVGCVIGFAGIVAVNFGGFDFGFKIMGEGAVLVSSISAAVGYVISKKLSAGENAIALTGWQQLIGGAALLVVGFACGGKITFTGIGSVAMLIFLAFSISAAYVVWSLLLKYNEVSSVTVYKFAVPLFGVLSAAVILGEWSALNFVTLLSMALVSVGILLVNLAGKNNKTKKEVRETQTAPEQKED